MACKSVLSGGICCESDIRRCLWYLSDSTQRAACNPGELRKERGVGENDRVINECKSSEKKGKLGTHVPRSHGEKEGKDAEVRARFLARGSTLAGYPRREEPEQPSGEGNCEISVRARQSISVLDGRGVTMNVIPLR